MQAYALTELFGVESKEVFSKQLLRILENSPHEAVRTQAYLLLRKYGDEYLDKAMLMALNDNYEYLKRKSLYDVTEMGNDKWIEQITKLYSEEQEARRIQYRINWLFQFLNHDKALIELNKQLYEGSSIYNWKDLLEKATKKVQLEKEKTAKAIEKLSQNTLGEKELHSEIRTLRAYRHHLLINIINSSSTSKNVKIHALEVLSWFGMSYQQNAIVELCNRIIQTEEDNDIKQQAVKTLRVIEDTLFRPF